MKITTENFDSIKHTLKAGDKVELSGTVYTARDAAHKRFFTLLANKEALPFDICKAFIYYAGPTPAPKGLAVGSCGPTTSSRMNAFAPRLFDMGLSAVIGKGDMSDEVHSAIVRNSGMYFCAIGGAGALASASISSCEVVAFSELGCESVKKLTFKDFPLFVGIDCHGNSIFEKEKKL